MSMSDTLGDMLTRIRNGQTTYKKVVDAPASRFRKNVLEVLKREGFIRNFEEKQIKPGINFFEIEDKPFEKIVFQELENSKIKHTVHNSPMFLFTRNTLKSSLGDKKLFRMGDFYKFSRKSQNILLDSTEKPVGGKWSFDEENRKKIPKDLTIPKIQNVQKSRYHNDIIGIIEKYFSDHTGKSNNFWFTVTRKDAENHLEVFLSERISQFGTYEDAMVENTNFLFHFFIFSEKIGNLKFPQKCKKSSFLLYF